MGRPQLKVVGGITSTPGYAPGAAHSGTGSNSTTIEDYIGYDAAQFNAKKTLEIWQDIAKSVVASQSTQRVREISAAGVAFTQALAQLKEDTKFSSSLSDIILHPSYQRIIGIGPTVIPFVLNELKQHGGHWSWALRSLTGENPVSEEDEGRTKRMAEAWLRWGEENGQI